MPTRLRTLALSAALALPAVSFVMAAEPPPLNVIHIISDDLNTDLGCYGSRIGKSPNIDRLAARGIRFDAAYCNYPLCNPSRASFLSGKRPETIRFVENKESFRSLGNVLYLSEYLRQQGYRTLRVGKVFHAEVKDRYPQCWDVEFDTEDKLSGPPPEQVLREQGERGYVLRVGDEATPDGKVARQAVFLIEENAKSGKPFYLAVGFRRPHTPYAAPEKYFSLYDPARLEPRWGPPGHLANIPPIALGGFGSARSFPKEKPGETLSAYYAGISLMDAQVGLLIETLDRLDLWKSTVVVFHSDHGYHLGEHGLWHKMRLFEECVRVPMIVAGPGIAPAVSSGLVELVDLYPTFADLCGLKPPGGLEGSSFMPLLQNPMRDWKRAVFTVVGRSPSNSGPVSPDYLGRSVFDGRWRYTEWPDGTAELYDHANDPEEYSNLAKSSPGHREIARMKQLQEGGWKAAGPRTMQSGPGSTLGATAVKSPALSKKIILIGGKKSHRLGEHDFPNGIPLFAAWMKASPAFADVDVLSYTGGWPADPRVLEGASSIVCYFDGVGEKPEPMLVPGRIEQLQRCLEAGTGLIALHQASTVPKGNTTVPWVEWLGAMRDGMVDRTMESMSLQAVSPAHPVSSGMTPFTYRDEFYPTLIFHTNARRVTPILRARIGEPAAEHVLAWTFERPNGGRSFGFTGGHFLAAFHEPEIRRMLLNAIAWTAKMPVPNNGIAVTEPFVGRAVLSKRDDNTVVPMPWGELRWFTSAELKNSRTMTTGVAIMKPGRTNPRHFHPNCDEILHVVSGRIRHTMNEVTVVMTAGDTVSIPSGVLHNAENIGDQDAVLAISFSSAYREAVGY